MLIVSGSVENSSDDHNFPLFIHFVYHPVGKPFGVAPADILTRMVAGVEQGVMHERVKDLNNFLAKLGAQTFLSRVIPI